MREQGSSSVQYNMNWDIHAGSLDARCGTTTPMYAWRVGPRRVHLPLTEEPISYRVRRRYQIAQEPKGSKAGWEGPSRSRGQGLGRDLARQTALAGQ